MDKINKLTLPATILIASIILGGFYYASQVNKQKSIERQQQVELKAETERQDKIKREETTKQLNLSICLETADSDYWNYLNTPTKFGNKIKTILWTKSTN